MIFTEERAVCVYVLNFQIKKQLDNLWNIYIILKLSKKYLPFPTESEEEAALNVTSKMSTCPNVVISIEISMLPASPALVPLEEIVVYGRRVYRFYKLS